MTMTYFDSFDRFLRSGDFSGLEAYLGQKLDAERLSIYRNGYYKSSQLALKANYPCVNHFLGEQVFRQVAKEYVNCQPPEHSELLLYGDHFIDALRQSHVLDQVVAQSAADFASLDQAWRRCLHAHDTVAMTGEELADVLSASATASIDAMRTVLSDTVVICKLRTKGLQQWLALQEGARIELETSEAQEPEHVLFWRTAKGARYERISAADHFFLTVLKSQPARLGAVTEQTLAHYQEFDASSALVNYLTSGVLTIYVAD